MTRQLNIFWTGMLVYALSFFLASVRFPGGPGASPMYGFYAAFFALTFPRSHDPVGHYGIFPNYVEWTALLVSGWINPVFIVTAFLDLSGQYDRMIVVLRIVLLAMFPFCWIFFARMRMYPREGYFVWVAGMLTVLFSNTISRIEFRQSS